MTRFTILLALFFVASLLPQNTFGQAAAEGEWIQLFNGKNLDGWTPKIRYHDLGENYGNTFRVEDGLLKVGYENYDGFGEQFGHLFFKDSFSEPNFSNSLFSKTSSHNQIVQRYVFITKFSFPYFS